MQRSEKEIIEKGELVALNRKPECGHFYLYGNEIFRAMPDRDEAVYPIVTKSELRKLIKNGVLLPGITMEEIEREIEATTESAKTETDEWCLLKAVNALKAKLIVGTFIGLKCNEGRVKEKFAALEKALNRRLKPKKKQRVKK